MYAFLGVRLPTTACRLPRCLTLWSVVQQLVDYLPNYTNTDICPIYIFLPSPQQRRSTPNDSWKVLNRAKNTKRSRRRCESIQSGTLDTLHHLHRRPLSGPSFQDALRAFFQPVKTDDPRLDFYTMYKREAMEYDTDYVKKYDEDLNITLIFVRHYRSLLQFISLAVVGRSVLCRQLSICHRCPFSTPTRSERPISSPPPRNPSYPQPVRYSGGDPCRSAGSARSTKRDRHCH